MSSEALRIDPHVHSQGSYDGHEPVELILEHAAEIGLDGVVITDHDTVEESNYAAEIAEEYGLLGIPGVEVSTANGHLLAIGVDETPAPGEPIQETVDTVWDMGGAAIVPHPFQRSRHGVRRRHIPVADAIEVYNSMLFTGYRNRRANVYAVQNDYPKVGASDAHSLLNVGRAFTEIDLDESMEDPNAVDAETIIRKIREGDTAIQGRRTPIRRSLRQYGKGAVRKMAYEFTARAPVLPTWPASMDRTRQ